MKNRMILSLAIVSFLLFSCSSSKSTAAEKVKEDITSKEWKLSSVMGADGKKLLPDAESLATLKVDRDGKVMGNTGCNTFNMLSNLKGSSLKFGKIAMTRKLCEKGSKIENALTSALGNVDNYTVEDGNLLLKKGSDVLATFSDK